ncbi:MAG: RDD family protein [Planctomycetaceae bacterium]
MSSKIHSLTNRLLFALVENVLLYFVLVISAMIIFPAAGPFGGREDSPEAAAASTYYAFYVLICYTAYFVLLESSALKGTFFKKVNGTMVVNLRGERISLMRALIRHAARCLTLIIFLTGYLTILFTKRKQALHDLLSGTMVVEEKKDDELLEM